MTGLLDYFNYSQGLLSPYDEQLQQNQLAQAELDARLNRDFTPQDYLLSSDPYSQAIKENDLTRYQGGFPEAVQSGFNTAKNYVADALSGQNRLDYEREGLLGKQAIAELPQDEQQQAIAQNAIERGFDWTAAGMIGGPLAKNANLKMLAKAKEMKKAGANKDLIFQETFDPKMPSQTGWYLDHPDNVPRFEIDDKGSKIRINDPKAIDYMKGSFSTYPAKLGDYFDHPNLYDNYDIQKTGLTLSTDTGGSFRPSKNNMDFGDHITTDARLTDKGLFRDYDQSHKVVAHESQHKIQKDEGFVKGGSPSMFNDMSDDLTMLEDAKLLNQMNGNKELFKQVVERDPILGAESVFLSGEPLESISNRIEKLTGKATPYQQYRNLAGESEARLASDRLNYSMDERLIDPFYDNYDVPFDDMILRNDSGLLSHSVAPKYNIKSIESKYKDIAKLDLYENKKTGNINISRISLDKGNRGAGKGSKIMEDIINYADENNLSIDLTPSTDYGGTSVNRLKKFYKRFGFVENKGKNRDFTISEDMYRPRKNNNGLLE